MKISVRFIHLNVALVIIYETIYTQEHRHNDRHIELFIQPESHLIRQIARQNDTTTDFKKRQIERKLSLFSRRAKINYFNICFLYLYNSYLVLNITKVLCIFIWRCLFVQLFYTSESVDIMPFSRDSH